jgi:DMSO/TMAO reductase YedYZ molybdopterin-dependent catalytic subunit
MPPHKVAVTLECAGNGRKHFGRKVDGEVEWGDGAVGTASWSGVSVAQIISAANLDPLELEKTRELLFVGADGPQDNFSAPLESKSKFVRALPMDKALDRDTIVALQMNGRPLPKDHGAPARLIVPGWYGMASVKWLSRIIFSSKMASFEGHYQGVKYVYETEHFGKPVKEPVTQLRVKSLITFPKNEASISLGQPVTVTGKAWSGFGRISRIEVDFGTGWKTAELEKNESPYAWNEWTLLWTPERKGPVTLRVRATDEKGNIQPESPENNRYLYGYNAIQEIHIAVI